MILGIRIDRRLISAVGLESETFTFQESRYSSPHRQSLIDYFRRLLDQARPTAVYYYMPSTGATAAAQTAACMEAAAQEARIPLRRVTKADLSRGFGWNPFRTRAELATHLTQLWPGIDDAKRERRASLAEATAVVGDVREFFLSP